MDQVNMNQEQANAFSEILQSSRNAFKDGTLLVRVREEMVKSEDLRFGHKAMRKYNAIMERTDLHTMVTNLAHMWGVQNSKAIVQHIVNAVRGMAPYASNKNVTMKLRVSDPLVANMEGMPNRPPYPHVTILWKMGGSDLYNIFVSVTWICLLVKSGLLISSDAIPEGYLKVPITDFLVHSLESEYSHGEVSNSVGLLGSDSLVQLINVFREAFPESKPLHMENRVHLKVIADGRHIVECISKEREKFVLLSPCLTNSSAPKGSKWAQDVEKVLPGYERCKI